MHFIGLVPQVWLEISLELTVHGGTQIIAPIDGQQLVALRIDIDQDTRAQLANAGIYCRNPQPEAYGGMELAA